MNIYTFATIIGALILLIILGELVSYVRNGYVTLFASYWYLIIGFLIPIWAFCTLCFETTFIMHMLYMFIGGAVDLFAALYLMLLPPIEYINFPKWIAKLIEKASQTN